MAYGIILAVAAVLIIVGNIGRNRWGINAAPVKCPTCGTPVPRLRMPRSFSQAMWGGWTCQSCGTRIDKWGNAVPPGG